ncbi:MAG: hypothetical protein A4E53_03884 [Pelotomaculum sp. PtaB.Bin104]|nr:MAG: hypothetical protein A4E53_03884 [Pelotomaculum sp. PtaB.Bin104]
MKWLMASPLRTLSPLGLLAVGAIVGVAGVPAIKKTARSLAVLTVKSALTISDVVKDAGDSLRNGWGKMIEEVQTMHTEVERKSPDKSHPQAKEQAMHMEDRETSERLPVEAVNEYQASHIADSRHTNNAQEQTGKQENTDII